jgi:hypothetical protein
MWRATLCVAALGLLLEFAACKRFSLRWFVFVIDYVQPVSTAFSIEFEDPY